MNPGVPVPVKTPVQESARMDPKTDRQSCWKGLPMKMSEVEIPYRATFESAPRTVPTVHTRKGDSESIV